MANSDMIVFSGRSSQYIAKEISEKYGLKLGKVNFIDYSDGEMQPSFVESVRGKHVFLIQSTFSPIDNLFELLLMIDAAYRASAYKIVAVIPYFGYGRQDRKDKPRVAIGAKLIANMLAAAGVSRVMTMDLHADQIQGFFDVPVDHLFASSVFIPHINSLNLDNLVVASPDMGGTKRANAYANHLHAPLVICHKSRTKPNEIAEMRIIGDVADKNIIIFDDIVDTAGTLTKAASLMLENGAKSVRAAITHPVLSGNAFQRIRNSGIEELIVTNSIPLKEHCDKVTVLSIAGLFADVINKVYNFESISSSFIL
ncbi:MAG: ribose-phosphate pyrophosphokinase [Bacteroidales bacterium]|nr:ribose-phosphate pyrophosphokinase [Bacteroidales bacterium]